MDLTTEIVKTFEGGQLEIQNSREHYLYRGEIERARVEDEALRVRFKWFAKFEDDHWYADDDLDYTASLMITQAQELSEGRIYFSIPFVGEHCTFFPPDGSKLDPNRVIGLQPVG